MGKTAAMQARGRWFKSLSRRIFVRTNNGWLVVSRQNLAVSRNLKRVRNEQRTVTLDGVSPFHKHLKKMVSVAILRDVSPVQSHDYPLRSRNSICVIYLTGCLQQCKLKRYYSNV